MADNGLLGRYFDILSNKHSNRKWVNRKMLIISVLQMLTIALLRRFSRVSVPLDYGLMNEKDTSLIIRNKGGFGRLCE